MIQDQLSTTQFIASLSSQQFSFSDLKHLLESKHQNLDMIFESIRNHPKYYIVTKNLLHDILKNIYKIINQKLEIHILKNIWKHQYLQLLVERVENKFEDIRTNQMTENYDHIFMLILMFLCQKMRNLKYQIRITAIQSFYQLIQQIVQLYQHSNTHSKIGYAISDSLIDNYEAVLFDRNLIKIIKNMLKKQQLVKIVSFSQGLFLQLLQDQFHQIRSLTLQTLQIIALGTPYFYAQIQKDKNDKNDTINTLKQMILYMLNDEHEIVRQKSLSSISKISFIQSTFEQKYQVFSSLSKQQISTILMCLRENNLILREKTYECLKYLKINNIEHLLLILQKIYQTLIIYKQDKVKIYNLLKDYSLRYYILMKNFIHSKSNLEIKKSRVKVLFEYNNQQQPNCKNIIYKGKLLLLKQIILDDYENHEAIWPGYIKRHLLYVEHLESKINSIVLNTEQQKNMQSTQIHLEDNKMQLQRQQSSQNIINTRNQQQKFVQNLQTLSSVIQLQMQLVQENTFKRDFMSLLKSIISYLRLRVDDSNLWEGKDDQNNENILLKIKNKMKSQLADIQFLYYLGNKKSCRSENNLINVKLNNLFIKISKFINFNNEKSKQSLQFQIKSTNQVLSQSINILLNSHYHDFNLTRYNNFKIKSINLNTSTCTEKLILSMDYRNQNNQKFDYEDLQRTLKNVWIKIVPLSSQPTKVQENQNIPNQQFFINFYELLIKNNQKTIQSNNSNQIILSVQLPMRLLGCKLTSFCTNLQFKKQNIQANQIIKKLNQQKSKKIQNQQILIKDVFLVFIKQIEIKQNKQRKYHEKILAE